MLCFPVILLDVSGQNNTFLVVSLKNYCVRRVVECIQHKITRTLDDNFKSLEMLTISESKTQAIKTNNAPKINSGFFLFNDKTTLNGNQHRKKIKNIF